MPADIEEQLIKHFSDAHSVEEQALTQMRKIAGDPQLVAAYERHLQENERHESLVRARSRSAGRTHRRQGPGVRRWRVRRARKSQAALSTSERAGSGRFSRLNLRLRAGKPRRSRPAARMAWRSATEMGWRVRGCCLWCVPSFPRRAGRRRRFSSLVNLPVCLTSGEYESMLRLTRGPKRSAPPGRTEPRQGTANQPTVYAGPSDERESRHGRDGQGDGNPAQNVRRWGTISPSVWRCRVDAHAGVLSRLLLRGSASTTSLPSATGLPAEPGSKTARRAS